jgi:transcriptional regulator with XRE-family HTH domain
MALRIGRSRLPELIHRNGMTPASFAAELGKSEPFISQIISGKAKFSIVTAKNAANILKCSIDDLWEWIDDGIR